MTKVTDETEQKQQEVLSGVFKPKIKVYKRQINRLCSWYTEQLSNEFRNRILNPSAQLLIERRLQELQYQQYRQEPQNTLWLVPVKVIFQLENNHSFEVTVADMNAIQVIDFDSRGF